MLPTIEAAFDWLPIAAVPSTRVAAEVVPSTADAIVGDAKVGLGYRRVAVCKRQASMRGPEVGTEHKVLTGSLAGMPVVVLLWHTAPGCGEGFHQG